MHLFTGSNGLSVGQPPVLDNTEPKAGYTWETAGEVLEAAGLDWKVLKMEDDFDDNAFQWFAPYINSKPGDALWDKGLANVDDLVASFGYMLGNDTLPAVTWIVGPEALSEHANWHPSAGEALSSQLIGQLQKYPDVYAKTVRRARLAFFAVACVRRAGVRPAQAPHCAHVSFSPRFHSASRALPARTPRASRAGLHFELRRGRAV
jgi:hypothetical protein